MIDSLKLTNFQGHIESELVFGPYVNAIIGDTDCGKSSIIRSIFLITDNKPSSDDFVHTGKDFTEVTLTSSGNVVTRKKGKGENSYTVNSQLFKAFGQAVPQEVSDALNIDSDVAFRKQSSPYFLLHSTESERGKLLDSFCKISIATNSVLCARRKVLHANKEAEQHGNEIIRLKPQQVTLHNFLLNRQLVQCLRDTSTKNSGDITKLGRYNEYAGKYNSISRKLDGAQDKASVIGTLCSEILSSINESKVATDRLAVLKQASTRLTKQVPVPITIPQVIDTAHNKSKYATLCNYAIVLRRKFPDNLIADVGIMIKLLASKELYTKLVAINNKYNSLETKTCGLAWELDSVNKELSLFKSCPLCGSQIGE